MKIDKEINKKILEALLENKLTVSEVPEKIYMVVTYSDFNYSAIACDDGEESLLIEDRRNYVNDKYVNLKKSTNTKLVFSKFPDTWDKFIETLSKKGYYFTSLKRDAEKFLESNKDKLVKFYVDEYCDTTDDPRIDWNERGMAYEDAIDETEFYVVEVKK